MKPRFILTVFLTLILTTAAAQNSQILYFMNLPQNHLLNPVLRPTNSIYIGLPGLTGMNLNITNNFINFSDVFSRGLEISKSTLAFIDPDFDRDKFLGKIKDLNYINPKAAVQLLGVGFKSGEDLYVFMDINDIAEVNVIFPRDLVKLAFLGNEEFAGQTLDLSSVDADFNYYREIGIGASKNITSRLRFGAKARLLFGITAGSFQNYALNLKVSNEAVNTLETNMAYDISGPVHFNSDNKFDKNDFDSEFIDSDNGVSKFLTNMKNAGFGLDLGAEFSVNDKIVLSAAIIDVGFIRWKSNLSNYEAVDTLELQGLDFEDIYEGRTTIDVLFEGLIDSLQNAFHLTSPEKPFTTKLPVGFVVGGKYNLNDKFSIGILSYSKITGQQIREALTVSANMNIGNKISTSLAYTACNHSYSNLGLGLGFRASVVQFYFLLDRIPLSWKKAGNSNGTFPLPANWNTLNTRVGLNLVFGNKARSNY